MSRNEITPWEPMPQLMDHSSTYQQHYQAWPIQPRRPMRRQQDERPQSATRFDTRSTMQDSFQPFHGMHATRSCRPTSAYEPKDWMHPLSTTHREAFQQWVLPRQTVLKPIQSREVPSSTPTGRSTMQDSYQPFAHVVPTKSAQPAERRIDPTTPFDGTTTSRASYQPWPLPPRHGRIKTKSSSWVGTETNSGMPNSTYRDMFREIAIPRGAGAALGVQVVGGKFHEMIARGTRPPVTKRVMMTTTNEKQTSMDIVIILASDQQGRKGRKLGEFELDGIAPARGGVPQVVVTFTLSGDHTLRVSAVDQQGQRARALTVRDRIQLG